MNTHRNSLLLAAGAVALIAAGCSPPHPTSTAVAAPMTTTSGSPAVGDSVVIDENIRARCDIDRLSPQPRFDFDSAVLRPAGRGALEQLGRCLTEGPLRGEAVKLVGHADPRGDDEYNMALGGYRATAVSSYLGALGVPPSSLYVTSRGELDARGHDEATWALDRRVDVVLEGAR